MMAFCIAQVTIPLLGFLGIKQLYETWNSKAKAANGKKAEAAPVIVKSSSESSVFLWKKVLLAFYIVGGFCLLIAFMGPSIMEMEGAGDQELKKQGYSNIIPILKEDRASLLQKDALRSLMFIAAAFGLLWAWFKKKVDKNIAIVLIGVFAAVDLISVDWRYLSWDDFKYEKGTVTDIVPDRVDKAIMADKELHFRIFDLTKDPFNDNSGAAFHKMVGGYDPAKLSRYQDIIAEILSKNQYQEKGLDMLNCKYLIGSDSINGRGMIQRPSAMGNAWFVSKLKPAKNALEDMTNLKAIDVRTEATLDTSYTANKKMVSKTYVVDSTASVKLKSYHPDTMVYTVQNNNPGYVVFSEIYYEDWKAEVDGQPVPVNKVNYTLRGVEVPAGAKNIKLYFNKGEVTTDNIEKAISYSILAGMLIMIGFWISTYFKKEEA